MLTIKSFYKIGCRQSWYSLIEVVPFRWANSLNIWNQNQIYLFELLEFGDTILIDFYLLSHLYDQLSKFCKIMWKIDFCNVLDNVKVSEKQKLWRLIQINQDFCSYVFLQSLVSGVNFLQSPQGPGSLDHITEKKKGLKLNLWILIWVNDLQKFRQKIDGVLFGLN